MLNTKKPLELRQELNRSYLELKRRLTSDAQLQRIEKREAEDEVVLIFNILDQQHQAIKDLEARVEELKRSKVEPNNFCFVEGCENKGLHSHAMPL